MGWGMEEVIAMNRRVYTDMFKRYGVAVETSLIDPAWEAKDVSIPVKDIGEIGA